MKHLTSGILLVLLSLLGCKDLSKESFADSLHDSPSLTGKTEYLKSPYVTAGNRVYMIGHQDGSFPELGWHIKGEMGGIWDHPIKLMDGFKIDLDWKDRTFSLDGANSFVNYPFANKHIFEIPDKNIEVERWQFVPDDKEGIAIQLIVKNRGENAQNFNLKFTGFSDLRPTWLGERTQMTNGSDTAHFVEELGVWIVKDSLNPWVTVFGSDQVPRQHSIESTHYSGNGAGGSLDYSIAIPGKTDRILNFVIAGSHGSKEEALATYRDILYNGPEYLNAKKTRYKTLATNSKLTLPDKKMQETFEWLKYNCDWLVRTVPAIGTGITAGLPDYPWWFGVDSEYALKGYMAVGQKAAVYSTIKLLDSISNANNGNGRIVHEVSTNGAVFNKGNINETPQFASLIWNIYQWNGDRDFLKKYFPTVQKGLDWLIKENDADNNLFPEGFGMMEIHGLDSEMIDVASYTQKAFADASKMALALGKDVLALQYRELAAKLKARINAEFWSEEFNSYADFIGTDDQALKLIEDAIVRADTLKKPWAVTELLSTKKSILSHPSRGPKPFVVFHNWVVNTPMEMGIADQDKALKALETASRFVNPFGVFVTGIDRDESAGTDDGSFKGSKAFSYTGAVMTLPTGVLAIAENNYGRTEKALAYLKKMTHSFSYALPGSMYEVSPDYGMMCQAWNIYAFAVPIVNQFFGINPDAAHKTVVIEPNLPKEWNNCSLENVEVGSNSISVFYKMEDGKVSYKITQSDINWTVKLILPQDPEKELKVTGGQKSIHGDKVVILSTAKELECNYQWNYHYFHE
ncbi:glycogen debranching protein [Flavobacteriaceae bacterium F89]|uniref:Glycogen debranching protein n=1 Tax=Cerina litoralis TaxID=2874477 RepID=A0AAE3EZD5_9FLAO|nr:glycogen debranching protein [Cerina litoralis]MCG2462521.1 glycogen debranching protein [Cerina litoralis]